MFSRLISLLLTWWLDKMYKSVSISAIGYSQPLYMIYTLLCTFLSDLVVYGPALDLSQQFLMCLWWKIMVILVISNDRSILQSFWEEISAGFGTPVNLSLSTDKSNITRLSLIHDLHQRKVDNRHLNAPYLHETYKEVSIVT